jgi:Putative DNA-binding domain
MLQPGKELVSHTIAMALASPTECTLTQLIADYGLTEIGILEAVIYVKGVTENWQLECNPPIGLGGLDDTRVLKRRSGQGNLEIALSEIQKGENDNVEFKETLFLDVKRFSFTKDLSQCFSEELIHSSLKTIAAFLNSGGGVLYIGVDDKGNINGVDRELQLLPLKEKNDIDGWQLFFWSQVEKYFVSGKNVISYLSVEIIALGGVRFARVVVGRRDRIVFIKKNNIDTLYIRSGNRTLSVQYCDIEDHFLISKR